MNKGFSLIFLIVFLVGIVSVASAYTPSLNFFYKILYYDGGVSPGFNQTLWSNSTSTQGSNSGSVTDGGTYIQVISSGNGNSGGTGTAYLNTTSLPAIGLIDGINLSVDMFTQTNDGAGGPPNEDTTIALITFGNTLVSITTIGTNTSSDNAIWRLIRNASNSNYFDVYRGAIFNKSFIPSDNKIQLRTSGASGVDASNSFTGRIRLNYLYYYNNVGLQLSSPSNNTNVAGQPIIFNASVLPGNDLSLVGATLAVYNSTGLFGSNSTLLSGTTPVNLSLSLGGFIPGPYTWTYILARSNGTDTEFYTSAANYTFTYGFNLTNANYNPSTSVSSRENFNISGTKTADITSISARMWYKGVPYVSTVGTIGNTFTLSNTLDITQGMVGSNNFFWEVTSTGGFGSFIQNSSILSQTVTLINLSFCDSPSPDGLTLNFTTYDTQTDLRLNASFEANFEYYTEGGTGTVFENYSYADLNQNRSNWMFCIGSNQNVSVNAFMSYAATGYDRRDYIIQDGIIGNFTQNIPLFLTLTSETDVVTVTVKDQNYNILSGALVTIQEWNVGTNTFSTIGMLTTSSEGSGIINLELYNTWYRAIVTYQGQIVAVTEVQKLSDTNWFIQVNLGTNNPYDLFGTISHGLTFDNSTNITTFVWSDSSGYVSQACLRIRNSTSLGYQTISLECITSVAGAINYQLPSYGTFEVTGTIFLIPTYNVSQLTDVEYIRLGTPSLTATVSPFGKVLSFLFIGTSGAVGIAASNPIWGAILMVFSIFLSGKLGWLNITEAILWGIVSIVIVIFFRISKK